ncbi:MAG TPA: cellulase family glycosylhydrolase [Gallionella sp.]|nr:cellulase family glycosylhydrolase [Gallionella sp.]
MRENISCRMLGWAGFFLCILCGFGQVYAAEMPVNWPWRGVGLDNIGNTPADIHELVHKLGINSVQLQLMPRLLAKRKKISANDAWNESLAWADKMLEACKEEKIVGIVELKEFPIDINKKFNMTSPRFWLDANELNEVLGLIEKLAIHLHTHGKELAAYDILDEPVMLVGGVAVSPPGWPSFQEQIVKRIRAHDSLRWVVVKPGPWGQASGYKQFSPLPFPWLVYSIHVYTPHSFTHQGIQSYKFDMTYPGEISGKYWDAVALEKELMPAIEFQKRNNVPVWVGEFSALRWAPGGEQYLKDLVGIFNRNGWGWSYFSFATSWNGWNPNYDDSYTVSNEEAELHKVGENSKRWQTVKSIFNVKDSVLTP